LNKSYSEEELITQCLENNTKAQEELYRLYSRKMYGLCLRFAKNRMDADDILQESFIKVFFNLKNYRSEGSFEGWIRRTVTTTAINHYKKFLRESQQIDITDIEETKLGEEDADFDISAEELICMLQSLPDVNRISFNLFVIEGYSHKEISQMLGIPENTSKSNLLRAKKMLQNKILKLKNISIIN
jgi:RNA polymerase sigma factor (sigma-70 family)